MFYDVNIACYHNRIAFLDPCPLLELHLCPIIIIHHFQREGCWVMRSISDEGYFQMMINAMMKKVSMMNMIER